MSSSTSLLIGLTGIARLAGVQRPVASVWRSRFSTGEDAFPSAVKQNDGHPLFDAIDVARWLERTEHGNNPDAVADAAATAAPSDFDVSDAADVDVVDALLALRTAAGQSVGAMSRAELTALALEVDPGDAFLRAEIERAPLGWAEWADVLADAAYTAAQGARVIERRHAATRASAGSAGPLTPVGENLVITLVSALVSPLTSRLRIGAGISPAFAMDVLREVGDELDVESPAGEAGRRIRRRLVCEAIATPSSAVDETSSSVHIHRLPTDSWSDAAAVLRDADEIALALASADRALIVAPSWAFTDALAGADDLARTTVLRSGRVRAVVRFGPGLVATAPRESMSVWVLGPPVGEVPIAERFTAIADLTDVDLSAAARHDVTSDVVAAMGSARDVRAHSFRFARLARTSSLLSSRGPLTAGSTARRSRSAVADQELPARIDRARDALGPDAPGPAPVAADVVALPAARVDGLLAARHLRALGGIRVDSTEFSSSGLVAVSADDLDDPTRIGERRVEPLEFATRHPSAKLTLPGDVIFRTSPTPRAWVDVDGSKVVVYPARVLRIDASDSGGLVPELIAADIATSRGGAGAWRRWMLRRVAPSQVAPLRASLTDLAHRRAELLRRVDALDIYTDLLASGITSGVVTLTEPAASAASVKK
ncbi:hypothetical protein QL996_04600 [Planococcus sp. APC 4015]|nr:hypothetical protein [Planococcus sp. APC 4015]